MMFPLTLIAPCGFSPARPVGLRVYERISGTCQNSHSLTGKLSVSSVSQCQERCDETAKCTAMDTDGASCYLKSSCDGTVGECSGWCGYRLANGPQPGPAPTPSPKPKPPTPPKPTPPAPPTPPGMTLRKAAAKSGIFIGAAGNFAHIQQDKAYAAMLAQEYNLVTAENACKWAETEPAEGQFNFSQCDVVRDFAVANKMTFRGHNLCWGKYNPHWLENGHFSADKKRELLRAHATTVAKYYGDAAYAWDVVNEAVSDSQKKPVNVTLKSSVWYPDAPERGEEVPGVKLFYNDYNIGSATTGADQAESHEFHPHTGERLTMGSADKSEATYNLAKQLAARGLIDGVGLQLHVSSTFSAFDGVAANMARLAALGLEIHVTELDVGCAQGCDLDQQASVYAGLLKVCLAQPKCRNFETWGFTDLYTWKGTNQRPLPFDDKFKPKPAFGKLVAELLSA